MKWNIFNLMHSNGSEQPEAEQLAPSAVNQVMLQINGGQISKNCRVHIQVWISKECNHFYVGPSATS